MTKIFNEEALGNSIQPNKSIIYTANNITSKTINRCLRIPFKIKIVNPTKTAVIHKTISENIQYNINDKSKEMNQINIIFKSPLQFMMILYKL